MSDSESFPAYYTESSGNRNESQHGQEQDLLLAFILDEKGNRAIGMRSPISLIWMLTWSTSDSSFERYWTLRNLKRNGFNQSELVKAMSQLFVQSPSMGQPAVFHSSLTDQQDKLLNRCQDHALKCIFGPGISGRQMRATAGLQSLFAKREEICDRFARKLLAHPRFFHLFPKKTSRSTSAGPSEIAEYRTEPS